MIQNASSEDDRKPMTDNIFWPVSFDQLELFFSETAHIKNEKLKSRGVIYQLECKTS